MHAEIPRAIDGIASRRLRYADFVTVVRRVPGIYPFYGDAVVYRVDHWPTTLSTTGDDNCASCRRIRTSLPL